MAILTIQYIGETGYDTGNHNAGTLHFKIEKTCKSFDFLNPNFSISKYLIIKKGFFNFTNVGNYWRKLGELCRKWYIFVKSKYNNK